MIKRNDSPIGIDHDNLNSSNSSSNVGVNLETTNDQSSIGMTPTEMNLEEIEVVENKLTVQDSMNHSNHLTDESNKNDRSKSNTSQQSSEDLFTVPSILSEKSQLRRSTKGILPSTNIVCS